MEGAVGVERAAHRCCGARSKFSRNLLTRLCGAGGLKNIGRLSNISTKYSKCFDNQYQFLKQTNVLKSRSRFKVFAIMTASQVLQMFDFSQTLLFGIQFYTR